VTNGVIQCGCAGNGQASGKAELSKSPLLAVNIDAPHKPPAISAGPRRYVSSYIAERSMVKE